MLAKRLILSCILPTLIYGGSALAATSVASSPSRSSVEETTHDSNAQTIKIGTGGKSGNYFSMASDIKNYCEQKLVSGSKLEVETTDGSVDNLMGMTEKEYSAAIVQEDVLQYFAKTQPREVNQNRLKIISGLHTESVHLLVPKGYTGDKNSDITALFESLFSSTDKKQTVSIDMLKGHTVGAWGGSVISAKALSFFMNLNLNVVEVPPTKRNAPDIPLLLVGGHPYKPVQDLLETGKYMLVPIDYSELKNKAPFYIKSSISYKSNGKIQTVPTFGVRALLVGKAFRRDTRNANMVKLARCIQDNLVDLADDPDTNPSWGTVYELDDAGEQTSWSYFPLK